MPDNGSVSALQLRISYVIRPAPLPTTALALGYNLTRVAAAARQTRRDGERERAYEVR